MLLPQRKLQYVEAFNIDLGVKKIDNYGHTKINDVINVDFFKTTKGWFGRIKEETWNEKFKFIRDESPCKDKGKETWTTYTVIDDFTELEKQLSDNQDEIQSRIKKGEIVISQEDYDFFSEKFPERFV